MPIRVLYGLIENITEPFLFYLVIAQFIYYRSIRGKNQI